MRDPRSGVDPAGFDQGDDAVKILGPGVPAAQKRELTPMESGVIEREVTGKKSDEHEPPALGGMVERCSHRRGVAGRVENGGWHVATGKFGEMGGDVGRR